ncbi:MAG: SDR family NAD(P)-dependent oxidoreductase [Novosphingobium sp.]
MSQFTGKTVLVTGAAGGLGAAIARRLSRDGAWVVATDVDAANLEAAVGGLDRVVTIPVDLGEPGAIGRLVISAEEQCGPLHGLVHCAAIILADKLLDCSLERWQRVLDINLTTTFELCQTAGRAMAERGEGVLIAFASGAGQMPNYGNLSYGVSKAGVIALMRSIAIDLARYGVRANTLIPGPIETPLMLSAAGSAIELLKKRAMLGRLGAPDEVANAIAFLLSDSARYMTGAVLTVDGGIIGAGMRYED